MVQAPGDGDPGLRAGVSRGGFWEMESWAGDWLVTGLVNLWQAGWAELISI